MQDAKKDQDFNWHITAMQVLTLGVADDQSIGLPVLGQQCAASPHKLLDNIVKCQLAEQKICGAALACHAVHDLKPATKSLVQS